jgi:UDP-N-acetylmuramyl pentapeptide phosphotransferase/UDP-N-acetylglucosamine-1-phosphate transferase
MDDNYGFKFWLKIAGLFVLGAIALFVFMWIFLTAIYAWGFLAAMLVLAIGALALGWLHDRRNARPQEGSY